MVINSCSESYVIRLLTNKLNSNECQLRTQLYPSTDYIGNVDAMPRTVKKFHVRKNKLITSSNGCKQKSKLKQLKLHALLQVQ